MQCQPTAGGRNGHLPFGLPGAALRPSADAIPSVARGMFGQQVHLDKARDDGMKVRIPAGIVNLLK